MSVAMSMRGNVWILAAVFAAGVTFAAERPALPRISRSVPVTATSHPFLSANDLRQPVDLSGQGYREDEYFVSGSARVYEWAEPGKAATVLGQGPYTTRILVRRPVDARRFNGSVIVEALNPSTPVDLPIMWAASHQHFMAEGYVWVGVTVKPNVIESLKRFDSLRYAALSMANPRGPAQCSDAGINPNARHTQPGVETGLVWDMLSQIGLLLKSPAALAVLPRRAQRLYMTGQSQTGGYSRTYATVFSRFTEGPDGKPLYDGYLYSGMPPWQIPLNQCSKDLEAHDPRQLTVPVGVPVIEMFAQGDIGTNVGTRRPDSDTAPDLFRRYEIAGAAHEVPFEVASFAAEKDVEKAQGGPSPGEPEDCLPRNAAKSDFPGRYAFNVAWTHLEAWVQKGVVPPRAERLQLKDGAERSFRTDESFIVDQFGNAKGGVRSPVVDVPTARWVGGRNGSFGCMFTGYVIPFDAHRLRSLYKDHADYVSKVRASAIALEAQGWLTAADRDRIVDDAEVARIP